MKATGGNRLFPSDLPGRQFTTFEAKGFKKPVAGVIFRGGEALGGVPLGGVGTGHLDLNTDGTLGDCTIFNSFKPRRNLSTPFLAVSVGRKTWVLTLKRLLAEELGGTAIAKQVEYWGHYPVADLQYELDCPLDICLRAYSPFFPGDAGASNTPASIFEVRMHNGSDTTQGGRIGFSFPGPLHSEVALRRPRPDYVEDANFTREAAEGPFTGVTVTTQRGIGYSLGIIGKESILHGEALATEGTQWFELAGPSLPMAKPASAGTTVAVEYLLDPGADKTVRFLLTWYHPISNNQPGTVGPNIHYYSKRFDSSTEIAIQVAEEHESIIERILAWQEAVYGAADLPVWLRDSLVNGLYCIGKNSTWFHSPFPDDWYGDKGVFIVHSSSSGLEWSPCVNDYFLGQHAALFLFPDLNETALRAFAHYQIRSGEIPFALGHQTSICAPEYGVQHPVCSSLYVHGVYNQYRRTNDKEFLREFYPSLKDAVGYLKSLDTDRDGLVNEHPHLVEGEAFPSNNLYESYPWYGTSAHTAGLWLATLRMAAAAATTLDDDAFADECNAEFERGLSAYDEKLWTGEYYRLWNDPETGRCSDAILFTQLIADWVTRSAGLGQILPQDKIDSVHQVVHRMNLTEFGLRISVRTDGAEDGGGRAGQSTGIFVAENVFAAGEMIYAGNRDMGEAIMRCVMENLVLTQASPWNLPNMANYKTGKQQAPLDNYPHMLALWAFPMALRGQDIRTYTSEGSLIAEVIKAASKRRNWD